MAHPEWVIKAKCTHIERPGQYDSHFECHSIEAEKGPISFKIVFTHPIPNGNESPPQGTNIRNTEEAV